MLEVACLTLGVCAGILGSIMDGISGMLMSLILPLTTVLGPTSALAYVVGYRGITSVTSYLNDLGTGTKDRKCLSEKGKGLSIARKCSELNFYYKNIALAIGVAISMIISPSFAMFASLTIMVSSIIFISAGWGIYIYQQENSWRYLVIIGALALIAIGASSFNMANMTAVLFLGLFSLRGMIQNKRVAIGPQSDRVIPVKQQGEIAAMFTGLCSCMMIGFPGSAVLKLTTGENEVKAKYQGAISDGIQDAIGMLLFFIAGSARDTTTSIISIIVGPLMLPASSFIFVAGALYVVSYMAMQYFEQIAAMKIAIHNATLNISNPLTIGLNVFGLAFVCSASPVIILLVLASGFGVSFFMDAWKIQPEFLGSLLIIMPALGLFGLL